MPHGSEGVVAPVSLGGRHIQLEVTPAAIDAIAQQGYDPTFGARPLKRVIQQQVQNPLAMEILKREFVEGSRVRVDYGGGEFTFERMDAAARGGPP